MHRKKTYEDVLNDLRAARAERARDQAIRATLGLLYSGLYYIGGDFRSQPVEAYTDAEGLVYLKFGLGDYRLLDARTVFATAS